MKISDRIRLLVISALAVLFSLVAFPNIGFAGVHISGSGAQSTTHANLQTTTHASQSMGVSFDILQMVRLGYTYRVKNEKTEGHRKSTKFPAPNDYPQFRNVTEETKQSVDLTIVPFATRILIPFIFGGMAQKSYLYKIRDDENNDGDEYRLKIEPGAKNEDGETINPEWGWNAGIGIRIPLNKDFSIKITQTWSEGRSQKPQEKPETVNDTYTEYGISYKL